MKIAKITDKIRREGLRGAAAAAIHRFASSLNHSKLGPLSAIPPARTEYLSWLSFAVPGMLTWGNVDAISFALQHLPNDAPMLEIGSFSGLSTSVIAYLRLKHSIPNLLFTCDRWAFENQNLGSYLGDFKFITHDQYRTFVRDSYLRNTSMFCKPDLPYTIETDSDTFFQRWRAVETTTDVFYRNVKIGGSLSFCYIDGNHTYEFAKRDFANTDCFLAPGGFILFDDSGDGSGWGVCQVVKEVLESGSYDLIAKNPNYLVQKRA
jgi:hypothetical protein